MCTIGRLKPNNGYISAFLSPWWTGMSGHIVLTDDAPTWILSSPVDPPIICKNKPVQRVVNEFRQLAGNAISARMRISHAAAKTNSAVGTPRSWAARSLPRAATGTEGDGDLRPVLHPWKLRRTRLSVNAAHRSRRILRRQSPAVRGKSVRLANLAGLGYAACRWGMHAASWASVSLHLQTLPDPAIHDA